MSDIRFAFRKLRQSPAFTCIAIVTLALGIGLNTAIFSLINDLFLRPLPFKEAARLVHMYSNARERKLLELAISAPRFQFYRDGQTVFDEFAAENQSAFTLTGLGDAVQLFGGRVTWNYFDVLGVKPIRGRNFLPNEEQGADVAMVTDNFWQKRMGGDPNVIGRSIALDGVSHTIVGVLPNLPFAWVGPTAEVWTTKPYVLPGVSYDRMMLGSGFLRVVGRLKAGKTIEQARAAMPSLEQSYRAAHPDKIDSSSVMTLKTLPEDVSGNLRSAFATLLAAVAFVLLIACSNVANLLLVRFSGRRREIALRMAIGASRKSIVRLFVFESSLVSAIAGVAGAALAWQLVPLIPKMAANFLPFDPATSVELSLPVLAFTILLSILTGLAMGIYPALQSSRADLVDGLKEGGRGASGSAHQQRFRKILVAAQVALSVALLAGAALLITSFVRLSQQNIGFQAENRWIGFVTLPEAQYPDLASRQRFAEQTLSALHTVSGLESATISADIPLLPGGGGNALYSRPDGEILPIDKRAAAAFHNIAPDYFKTWGIPLLSGREFDQHDTAEGQAVIIISQSGAKKIFGNENPIGKALLMGAATGRCRIVPAMGAAEFSIPQHRCAKQVETRCGNESSAVGIGYSRSRSRHRAAAIHGYDRRASARPNPADDMAARIVCRDCALARHNRNLRSCRLHRRATDRRDWCSYGARCAGERCFAPRRQSGNASGVNRIGVWVTRHPGRRPADFDAALSSFAAQPFVNRARGWRSDPRRSIRLSNSRAARRFDQPNSSIALGVNTYDH
jgi:putative ABC transport system permease protein